MSEPLTIRIVLPDGTIFIFEKSSDAIRVERNNFILACVNNRLPPHFVKEHIEACHGLAMFELRGVLQKWIEEVSSK